MCARVCQKEKRPTKCQRDTNKSVLTWSRLNLYLRNYGNAPLTLISLHSTINKFMHFSFGDAVQTSITPILDAKDKSTVINPSSRSLPPQEDQYR